MRKVSILFFMVGAALTLGYSSSLVSAQTTPAASTPSITSGITGCLGDDQPYIDVDWTDSTDTTNYRINRDGNDIANTGTQSSYRDSEVSPGISYTYMVAAQGPGGESSWSDRIIYTADNCDLESSEPTCLEDTWSCGAWSECLDGSQTRSCTKTTDCPDVDTLSPSTTQECTDTPADCTSWTYSDWGTCTDGQQTRSVVTSSPDGCSGGSPTLSQSCTTECTEDTWECEPWGSCSPSGIEERNCTKTYDCLTAYSASPPTTQTCTYIPTTCTSWTYSDWGDCSSGGQQERTIVSSLPEGCVGGSPVLSQSCTIPGPIIESISPTTIHAGSTYVTINGSDFMDDGSYNCYDCEVLVNGTKVTGTAAPYLWYENKVTFRMPSTAQSGYLQVKDKSDQLSNKFNFSIYQEPPIVQPTISSISPKTITPGDTITISGNNFGSSKGSSHLVVGGSNYPSGTIVSWANTKIEYKTSAYSDKIAKKIEIKKCKSYSDCSANVSGGYYYIQPKITSLDYSVGAVGDTIKIYGNYLQNGNVATDSGGYYHISVYFNGTKAFPPQDGDWTPSVVEAVVPQGATDGYVTLEITADGTSEKVTATGPYFDVMEAISNDKYSAYQEYFRQINLPQAWGKASNRRKIIVAVLDQGIYTFHPDLQDHLWTNINEIPGNGKDDDNNGYVDDYWGWDFVYETNDVAPTGDHGTRVAGIIGAIKDNNKGIAGVNPNVSLMPVIVLDRDGSGSFDILAKAIRYAVDNKAEVINLSLATANLTGFTTKLDEAIEYAYDNNVLIVAAAGNGDIPLGNGINLEYSPQSPVCNDGGKNMVIGVGAVDDNNVRTGWSNYGPKCVDIYAPGMNILSTSVPSANSWEQKESIDGNGYYSKANGTSFSAPIIAGVVSLLKATYPTLTSQEAINLLINNSNNGVVDAYKVLNANFTPSKKQITTPKTSNATNNTTDKTKVVEEERKLLTKIDKVLSKRLKGTILLQVEKNGEGWYVYPDNEKKYYLGRPADAFSIMRNLGLGIRHDELAGYLDSSFPSRLSGKILLDVEQNGEAYYINPKDLKGYFLNRPSDAFRVMRELGLGITNSDIRKIDVGETE